jgi:hypothetical protein
MSLPRNRVETDILDLSLKHTLKNWVSRSKPPVDGRSRLLNAASGAPARKAAPKMSKLSILISMTLNENFLQIYLDSLKKNPYYSLQPGALTMNYSSGMIVK